MAPAPDSHLQPHEGGSERLPSPVILSMYPTPMRFSKRFSLPPIGRHGHGVCATTRTHQPSVSFQKPSKRVSQYHWYYLSLKDCVMSTLRGSGDRGLKNYANGRQAKNHTLIEFGSCSLKPGR